MNCDSRTLEALKKAPFFEGPGPSQVKKLLANFHAKALPKVEKLCQMGEPSSSKRDDEPQTKAGDGQRED